MHVGQEVVDAVLQQDKRERERCNIRHRKQVSSVAEIVLFCRKYKSLLKKTRKDVTLD
jgi:hypothetical protein